MLKNIAKLLLGLSIFAPLIVDLQLFFPFITGKAIFFRVLIELALLFCLLHILFSKNRKAQWLEFIQPLKNPLVASVTAFTLIFLISSLTAHNFTHAFWSNFERGEGAFQIIHYYFFFVLIVSLFRSKKDIEKLLLAFLISASYIAIYGVLQWINLDTKFSIIGSGTRISGTLGNASYLAALMLFAIGFLLYFFVQSKNLSLRIFSTILGLFFLAILFKTGTRGALLGLVFAGLAFLISSILRKSSSAHLKKISIALLTAILIFSGLFFSTHKNPTWKELPLIGRQLQLERAAREFQPRIWSWNSAIQGIKERPILGWGAENYPFVYDKYYDPRNFGIESFFDRVHNLYLEHLITGGILLFLAFLTLLFFLFKRIFKRKKDALFSIFLAIVIAYLVQAFFLFDVLIIYLSFYLFLALLLNKELEESEQIISLKLSLSKIISLLALSLLLLLNTLFFNVNFLFLLILSILTIIIFYERENKKYFISLLDFAIAAALITLSSFLIYKTAYIPLQKNKALIQTFATNNVEEKYLRFQEALSMKSPIGHEEVVGSLNNLMLGLSERLIENPNLISIEVIQNLVDLTNTAHDQSANILTGMRHTYTNGGFNMRLGFLYGQEHLINRGKHFYYEALEIAPTRIEFIVLLIEVARVTNDEESYRLLRQAAIELRPDLAERWPPIE